MGRTYPFSGDVFGKKEKNTGMSQAKVDKRKQEKKDRAKNMRKEKFSRFLTGAAGVVIVAAIGVWVGFSVYQRQQASAEKAEVEYTDVNMSAIYDFEDALDGD